MAKAKKEKVERRTVDRATVTYPVTLISGGQLHYTQTASLSESGLFLNHDHHLSAGKLVNLIITLPDHQVISSAGEVCFVQPDLGAGIKFLSLKPSDQQKIERTIRRHYAEQQGGNRTGRTRRKEPRSRIAICLTLHRSPGAKPHRPQRVQTEDISRRGACLLTPMPPEIGQIITLTCVQEECEIRAVVKYAHPGVEGWRTGVQFLSFPKKWLIMELAVSALLEGTRPGA
jgi:hypothetical protein